MIKPNFLIIGAPKSGTTSLYNYLSQHPDIGFSRLKEPKYFSFKDISLDFEGNKTVVDQIKRSTVQDLNAYQDLFKDLQEPFVGEATPNYLHVPSAAKNIYEYHPEMKLIAILRNPIDKTFSDWKHNYAMGYETVRDFRKALLLIDERKRQNGIPYFDYLDKSNYATHLKRYLTYFPKTQIKIILYDDFKVDPNKSCNEILEFLGAKTPYDFDTDKVYMKGKPLYKSRPLKRLSSYIGHNFSKKIQRAIDGVNTIDPHLKLEDRTFLIDIFKDEIHGLEELLDRDLRFWLK